MHDLARARYPYASLTEAVLRVIKSTTQREDENLVDYVSRFKSALNVLKSHVGDELLENFDVLMVAAIMTTIGFSLYKTSLSDEDYKKIVDTMYDLKNDIATIESFIIIGDPSVILKPLSIRPDKPNINGPSKGEPGNEYIFTVSTTDSEGDDIYYKFDWGDGNKSKWIGPFKSGESINYSYIWETRGRYNVKVVARDEQGTLSHWSDPLIVRMPRIKLFNQIQNTLGWTKERFIFL